MLRTLLAAALICSAGAVFAHSWYDLECCSGHDCFPVAPDAVQVQPDGNYRVKRSGEVFSPPEVQNGERRAKWSKDGRFHLCAPNGDRNSQFHFCLYVPRPAEG